MFHFFRKHIKLVIWVIVLSFAAWGAGTIAVSQDKTASYAGKVFGEKISHKEFMTVLRLYDLLARAERAIKKPAPDTQDEKTEGSNQPPVDPKQKEPAAETAPAIEEAAPLLTSEGLRSMAWQSIILSREAKREHLNTTDEEVAEEVKRLFSGSESFDPEFYRKWVEINFRTQPRDFEEAVRIHLAAQKTREHLLKDVAENDRNNRWLQKLIEIMGRAKLEDFTQEPSKQ